MEIQTKLKSLFHQNLYGILHEYLLPCKIEVKENFQQSLDIINNLLRCQNCDLIPNGIKSVKRIISNDIVYYCKGCVPIS